MPSGSQKPKDVKEEMQKEFDRQTREHPSLWKAFANEDPSLLADDDEPTDKEE